jgi:ABC-type transporter Mla subunit MlaD
MRRALGLFALIGVGVLLGFLVRLVWPRNGRPTTVTYQPPSGVRRSA